jgi:hypothetical protein
MSATCSAVPRGGSCLVDPSAGENARKNAWHSPRRSSLRADDATIKARQRSELVTLLREAANLGLAGLVFGQVVSSRPFSWPLVVLGVIQWLSLGLIAIWIAGGDES